MESSRVTVLSLRGAAYRDRGLTQEIAFLLAPLCRAQQAERYLAATLFGPATF
jgi:hypothetical protein